MDIVVTIFALVTGLAVLGGASINWGVDTTDSYPDDHQRRSAAPADSHPARGTQP